MSRHWRHTLLVTAVVAAVFEAVEIFVIDIPLAALTFAALYAIGAVWLARGSKLGAPVLLVLLNLVELAGLPVYDRKTSADWIVQLSFGALCLVSTVAAVVVVAMTRRDRRPVRAGSAS